MSDGHDELCCMILWLCSCGGGGSSILKVDRVGWRAGSYLGSNNLLLPSPGSDCMTRPFSLSLSIPPHLSLAQSAFFILPSSLPPVPLAHELSLEFGPT